MYVYIYICVYIKHIISLKKNSSRERHLHTHTHAHTCPHTKLYKTQCKMGSECKVIELKREGPKLV